MPFDADRQLRLWDSVDDRHDGTDLQLRRRRRTRGSRRLRDAEIENVGLKDRKEMLPFDALWTGGSREDVVLGQDATKWPLT